MGQSVGGIQDHQSPPIARFVGGCKNLLAPLFLPGEKAEKLEPSAVEWTGGNGGGYGTWPRYHLDGGAKAIGEGNQVPPRVGQPGCALVAHVDHGFAPPQAGVHFG